jgi:hypothetical protein
MQDRATLESDLSGNSPAVMMAKPEEIEQVGNQAQQGTRRQKAPPPITSI